MSRLITILVLFSLILIFGVSFIWPKYQRLVMTEKITQVKKTELERKEAYLEDLRRIDEQLKNYQNQLAKIDLALPSEPNLSLLFDFFQKITSQTGLVLGDLKISGLRQEIAELKESKEGPSQPIESEKLEPKEKGPKVTRIELAVSGDYPSFKNFLSILEKSARLIEVEEISFFFPEKEGPLKFNLKIKVYSY